MMRRGLCAWRLSHWVICWVGPWRLASSVRLRAVFQRPSPTEAPARLMSRSGWTLGSRWASAARVSIPGPSLSRVWSGKRVTTMTRQFFCAKSRARWLPMKPLPPRRMTTGFCSMRASLRGQMVRFPVSMCQYCHQIWWTSSARRAVPADVGRHGGQGVRFGLCADPGSRAGSGLRVSAGVGSEEAAREEHGEQGNDHDDVGLDHDPLADAADVRFGGQRALFFPGL